MRHKPLLPLPRAWLRAGSVGCFGGMLIAAATARADILYVDDSAVNGANNGSSWQNAFTNLQDALAAARTGDEIRVAQGVYKPAPPNGPRDATFNLVSGTTLRGGYAGVGNHNDPHDPALGQTALSGDLNGDDGPPPQFLNSDDNAYHVVTADGVTVSTHLVGITITAGHANDIDPPHDVGGGLRLTNGSSITILNSAFSRNRSRWGGAGIVNARGLIRNCTFDRNDATLSGNGVGGAISTVGDLTIDQCVFHQNFAFVYGGAVYGPASIYRSRFVDNWSEDGGALFGALFMSECDFLDNAASFWGGAARDVGVILNCRFFGNTAMRGGAVLGVSQAVNCLFSGNYAWQDGGGAIVAGGPMPTNIVNCTFTGNESDGEPGGAIYSVSPHLTLANSILWGNQAEPADSLLDEQFHIAAGFVDVHHCVLQGWPISFGDIANTGDNPMFIDADGPDNAYGTLDDNPRLASNSSARDNGDMRILPQDDFDLDHDGVTAEPLPIDLAQRRRIVSDVIDRGAFEFQTCPGDILPAHTQGDSVVNIEDLLAILTGWGACSEQICAADIVPNGSIDVDDLLVVMMGWGACD